MQEFLLIKLWTDDDAYFIWNDGSFVVPDVGIYYNCIQKIGKKI